VETILEDIAKLEQVSTLENFCPFVTDEDE
jgi:hypothetical protein